MRGVWIWELYLEEQARKAREGRNREAGREKPGGEAGRAKSCRKVGVMREEWTEEGGTQCSNLSSDPDNTAWP